MFGNIGLIRDRNDLRRQWHHREAATTMAADLHHSPATIPKNVVSTPKTEASPQVPALIERPSLESRRSLGEDVGVVAAAERGRDKANRTE
jgi:hypothetical protein